VDVETADALAHTVTTTSTAASVEPDDLPF
jgi:hypothetical protein